MLYLCRNIVRMFLWQNDKNVYNKFYKTKSIKTTVLHMGRINIPAISVAGWSPKRPKYPLSFSGTETQYSSLKGVVHLVVENNLIKYNIYSTLWESHLWIGASHRRLEYVWPLTLYDLWTKNSAERRSTSSLEGNKVRVRFIYLKE